jgi:SulP family sulfate permease
MARTNVPPHLGPAPLSSLPAAALRACLREGYNFKQFRADLGAGVVVGVLALPLAMALAIAVGMPPQAGIYTSIVAGALTPMLGGSRLNVVGPTAAFVVVLAPVVEHFGPSGLLMAGLMAGVILLTLALLRLGRLIEYIPYPVATGFTAGIAVVIATLQLKDALGLVTGPMPEPFLGKLVALWQARATLNPAELGVTILTLGILLLPRLPNRWLARLPKRLRKVPAPLWALPAALLAGWLIPHCCPGAHVITLGERFHYPGPDGSLLPGIPRQLPGLHLPWPPLGSWQDLSALLLALAPSAFAIAALGAIESLLSAVVADGMAHTRHDPDAELFGLGIANMVTPFFGGIPATGAIARTASNVRFGGRSPFAALVHAATVLLAVLALAPLLGRLPLSSLAALLLMVAWNMSELEHCGHILKVAPLSDKLVLLLCFGLTVAVDMVTAVGVGVVLGALFFMARMAAVTRGDLLAAEHPRSLKLRLPAGLVLFAIDGPLFFGAAERAMAALRSVGGEVKAVVFLLEDVAAADMSGLVALEGAVDELHRHGIKVALVGARPPVKELLLRAGLGSRGDPGRLLLCDSLRESLRKLAPAIKERRKDHSPIRINVLHRHKNAGARARRQTG